jgi:hypothetical protein
MPKGHDQQLAAMARRGYEKWRREVRTADDANAIRRFAKQATADDTQKFFSFTEAELIEALSGK